MIDEAARRAEAACDAFEAAWSAGTPPDIDQAAEGFAGDERHALLRELVGLDVHYRRKAGMALRPEEYAQRFPGLDTASLHGPPADSVLAAGTPAEGGAPAWVGGYEILGEVARGGMGVVYRARQPGLGRVVALKMILPGQLAAEAVRRFRTEAEHVARLAHEGIVPVFEVGEHEGRPYFTMKLIDGGGLDPRRLADPRAATRVLALAARAVHHAHQHGIIHRDLKPGNILLDAEGRPHVTDFGLAKRLAASAELTRTNAIVGTPCYMSPEQAAGQPATVASDVYGLGAVLYEMLAGRPPFKAEQPLETLRRVLHDDPEPPSRARPGVPRDLEVICLKCLAKEPGRRYGSALEVAEDLERWLSGVPIAARPAGSVERAWRWTRRNPTLAALVLVALLGVAGVVGQWRQAVANGSLAEAKRREAEAASEELRHSFYAAQMNLIPPAWEAGDVVRVRELLDELRPKEGEEDLRGFEWHYWWRLCHSSRRTVKIGPVQEAAFSPDGSLLAACKLASGKGPGVSIIDVTSGEERRWLAFELPDGHAFETVIWDAGGERVAVASRDTAFREGGQRNTHALRAWHVGSGRPLLSIDARHQLSARGFSPDGGLLAVFSSGADDIGLTPIPSEWHAAVWGLASGKELFRLTEALVPQAGGGLSVFSPDGKRILLGTGLGDGILKGRASVHDARTGKELFRLQEGAGAPDGGFTPDGKRIAVSLMTPGEGPMSLPRSRIAISDGATGKILHRFREGVVGGGLSLADGGTKLIGKMPEADPGKPSHPSGVWEVDGGRLAGSFDTEPYARVRPGRWPVLASFVHAPRRGGPVLRVWDLRRPGEGSTTIKGHTAPILDAAFSRDGTLLHGIAADGELKTWDAPGAEAAVEQHVGGSMWPDAAGVRVRARPGGQLVLELIDDSGKRCFGRDSAASAAAGSASADRSRVVMLEAWLTPDDPHILATCLEPATGRVAWKRHLPCRPTRGPKGTPGGPVMIPRHFADCRLSADGSRVALLAQGPREGDPAKALLIDGRTGEEVALPDTPGVLLFGFTPDGSRLLGTGEEPASLVAWDAMTGRELSRVPRPRDMVPQRLSADGRALVLLSYGIGDAPAPARVVRVEDGATIFEKTGPGRPLADLSPDGARLALAWAPRRTGPGRGQLWADTSGAEAAAVWDVATGGRVCTLRGHGPWLTGILFSPDGSRVVTTAGSNHGMPDEAVMWDARRGRELLRLHSPVMGLPRFDAAGMRLLMPSRGLGSGVAVWDARPVRP